MEEEYQKENDLTIHEKRQKMNVVDNHFIFNGINKSEIKFLNSKIKIDTIGVFF
mgnify:CR=1 FL=1